jgi:hypothetical protein
MKTLSTSLCPLTPTISRQRQSTTHAPFNLRQQSPHSTTERRRGSLP